jgi:hypothetical protein
MGLEILENLELMRTIANAQDEPDITITDGEQPKPESEEILDDGNPNRTSTGEELEGTPRDNDDSL